MNWKKIINPVAIFYIIIIVVITLLIGIATQDNNSNKPTTISKEFKTIKVMTQNKQIIILETNLGNIEIALFPDAAPKTVENFLKLAESSFYDNTKFHRVIKDFMIQGGDPYSKGEDKSVYGTGGPGYKFADEVNDLEMVRGTLAMANSGPNTNGSQFFIVTTQAAPWLNGKHTIFGQVISGMEIVNKIENLATDDRDLPLSPVIIGKVIIK